MIKFEILEIKIANYIYFSNIETLNFNNIETFKNDYNEIELITVQLK